jgi:hypothetical protein
MGPIGLSELADHEPADRCPAAAPGLGMKCK